MSEKKVTAQPVILRAPNNSSQQYEEVQLPLTEKELARERLRAKMDVLSETVSVRAQMQAEPLKVIGGASAVGAILGLALGSQIKRTERVYVDANSPVQYQKRLIQAQKKEQGQDITGALFGTLVAVGVRALSSKLIREKLGNLTDELMAKANGEQPSREADAQVQVEAPSRPAKNRTEQVQGNPAASRFVRGADSSLASTATTSSPTVAGDPIEGAKTPTVQAGVSQVDVPENGPVRNAIVPGSHVTEKADGSLIQREELRNPNEN